MKIQRGIKFRLYLTPEQAQALQTQGHAARAMWNLLHEWWSWGGRSQRPTPTPTLADKTVRQRRSRKPAEPISNRLKATYTKIDAVRSRAVRRRADWQHKITHTLAEVYSLIGLEDLNVTAMARSARGTVDAPGTNVRQKAGLNRAIQGQAWGRLHTQLTYKSTERGGTIVTVPAPRTSQRCHRCGFADPKNRKNQATFACQNPACGWVGNADTNAAKNVRLAAITAAGGPAPGSGVAGRRALQTPVGARKRQPKRKAPA